MKSFFDARRIAVIGAARESEKVGNVVFRSLLGNNFLKVFPVNPNADNILGFKCFKSVFEIPYPVDMAVIAIKSEFVLQAVEDCGKKGIKNVVVISAGFSEAGNKELEDKIVNIAEEYKIKLLGPNVLGIINTYKNMNASFFSGMPEKGKVALVSQSGAIGTSLLDRAVQEKLGMSSFIPLGNMAQQDFISALEYLEGDVNTEVIMLYVESLKENSGKEFVDLCKKITGKKKIIAIKSGKSKEGEKAAKTHTASLSSPSEIYSGAFKQAGIIEADSLDEMFLLAKIYSSYGPIGKRALVVSNAGGLGVLTVDALSKAGIRIEEIPEKMIKELDDFLPKGYSRRNPLDILGDALAERYEKTMNVLQKQNFFDFFVVILSPQKMTQPLETAKVLLKLKKPVLACYIGGKSFEQAKKFLTDSKMIVLDDVSKLETLGKIV